jgi:integrase/recombinase XerD
LIFASAAFQLACHQAGNPALFVKGPRFSRQVDITPIMESEQVRQLLDSIPIVRKVKVARKQGGGDKEVADLKGLRDRAAIAIMGYTFARVSVAVGLDLADYRLEGKRARLRLMEKGNKEKLVWLHREAEEFLDAYIQGGGYHGWERTPLPDSGQSAQIDRRSPRSAQHAAGR